VWYCLRLPEARGWGRPPIKKTIRNIAVFAAIVVVLYLLLPKLVDTEKTFALLTHASYVFLAVAVVFEVGALLGYGNLTRFVLRVLDIQMRLRDVLAITLSSLAVSHMLSAGGVGGWVVTYNALRKRRVPHGLIFVAIAAQQFFNYVVLWLVFALALLWLVIARGESIAAYIVGIVIIGLILWLTSYGIYLYHHRTRMRRRVQQFAHIVNRVTRRDAIREDHIDGWIDNLFAGMRRMTSHHGAIRTTAGLACAFWAFDLLCLWATFFAFHYRIGFGYLAVGYVVAYAIGTLAPTPGGLGAIEGIMIALYVSFGVPSSTAVAVVLVYRLINFWLPIAPGLIAYVVVRPGRAPVQEGEIEEAAEEACEMERTRVRPQQ
jgi:glycosyltransferase 2 family protein